MRCPNILAGVQDILKQFEITASFLIHTLTGRFTPARSSISPTPPTASSSGRWRKRSTPWRCHSAAPSARSTAPASRARRGWNDSTARCMPVFRELKRIFDPKNLLNPGKIVGPDPSREAWPLRPADRRQESGAGVRSQESGDRKQWASSDRLPTSASDAAIGLEGQHAGRRGRAVHRLRRLPDADRARADVPGLPRNGHEAATPAGEGQPASPARRSRRRDARRGQGGRDLCVNCKMCRDECAARVNIPKLMLEAKAAHPGRTRAGPRRLGARPGRGLAALGSNFAPIVNGLLARRPVRWVMEKLSACRAGAGCRRSRSRNFFRRAGAEWG